MANENLWSALKVPESSVTPKSILEESAKGLAKQTQDILKGEVKTKKPNVIFTETLQRVAPMTNTNDLVVGSFWIIAPKMNNYNVEIIRITYSILEFYPLILEDIINDSTYDVKSEEEYRDYLKRIIQSEAVLRITQNLIIQSLS